MPHRSTRRHQADLGVQIRDARTAAGLTQTQLGRRLGVTRQTVSNWENGRKPPSVAVRGRLHVELGLDDDLHRRVRDAHDHAETQHNRAAIALFHNRMIRDHSDALRATLQGLEQTA